MKESYKVYIYVALKSKSSHDWPCIVIVETCDKSIKTNCILLVQQFNKKSL